MGRPFGARLPEASPIGRLPVFGSRHALALQSWQCGARSRSDDRRADADRSTHRGRHAFVADGNGWAAQQARPANLSLTTAAGARASRPGGWLYARLARRTAVQRSCGDPERVRESGEMGVVMKTPSASGGNAYEPILPHVNRYVLAILVGYVTRWPAIPLHVFASTTVAQIANFARPASR